MDIQKMCLLELLRPVPSSSNWNNTSSSSSSSDDDKKDQNSHISVNSYVETAVKQYSGQDFKQHFRMERATVEFSIQLYGLHTVPRQGGWPQASKEKAVLLNIWYLSNMETFRQISDRFDVTLSCAHSVVKNVTHFLVRISKDYIKWPNAVNAQEEAISFARKKGIENILGAIDGTHFRINRPQIHQEDYCNRKGFHSVILQGVVNASMEFINIHVGEPGSMHDARVLRRCSLYRKCQNNPNELFYGIYKLLGDSAYPSSSWLLTPMKDNGHLTEENRNLNYRHSSTRIVIENGFGHLNGRFRRLQKFDNIRLSFIVNCITAACVLHNICQRKNGENDEVFFDEIDQE